MKKTIAALAAGLVLPLFSAEKLPVGDFSLWSIPKNWNATPGKLEYQFVKWSSVSTTLVLPRNGVYRMSFRYRSPGAKGVPLKVQIGKQVAAAYPATETWNRAAVYFHAEGSCPFAFLAEGRTPYTLQIEFPQLERLEEPDCRKISLDANDGTAAFRTLKGEAHQTVKVTDHIDEGAAFLCRGDGAKELRSIEIPAQPGKRYRLSFWVKGSPGTLRTSVDGGWFPNVKYWSFGRVKPVSEHWKKHSLEFLYPSAEQYPYLKRRLLGCRFSIPSGQQELLLKGIEFEQIP